MDTVQWPQEITVKPMEGKIIPNNSSNKTAARSLERKIRPEKDEAVNCPRCNSTNTKFCYYNNYSLTQPRYFCKTCKRYWTEGGSLRNIPVGGASRKNKRPSSSVTSLLSAKRISSHDLSSNPSHISIDCSDNQSKVFPFPSQDLNLGFHPNHHQEFTSLSEYIQLPIMENTPNPKGQLPNSTGSSTTSDNQHHHQQQQHLSALELLNGLTSSTRGLTSFMPMSVSDPNNANGVYSTGYITLPDFKPNLNFSLDGLGNGYGNLPGQVQNSGDVRLLFPFKDLKQAPNNADDGMDQSSNINDDGNDDGDKQNRSDELEDSTTGYWSGMLGTGGPW